jgi:hypothetical protein
MRRRVRAVEHTILTNECGRGRSTGGWQAGASTGGFALMGRLDERHDRHRRDSGHRRGDREGVRARRRAHVRGRAESARASAPPGSSPRAATRSPSRARRREGRRLGMIAATVARFGTVDVH